MFMKLTTTNGDLKRINFDLVTNYYVNDGSVTICYAVTEKNDQVFDRVQDSVDDIDKKLYLNGNMSR